MDIVFTGGRVFRGLHGGFAEAFAVADGRVAAVGTRAEIEDLAGLGTRRVDLAGRVAIPAFNEAHMHLLPYGLGLSQVNLRAEEVTTLDEALGRIAAAARNAPKGAWVLGRGYCSAAATTTARSMSAATRPRRSWTAPRRTIRCSSCGPAAIWASPTPRRCASPASATTRPTPRAA
jgi:predicted amidohydrolase YtcJ